jgi:cytochrome c556
MKIRHTLLLAALGTTLALPSMAQFAKPEDAIKYRKSALFVMGQHFGRLGAMAQGRVPYDAKAAAENAVVLETVSKLPWTAFGEGTDKGETRAKPEIWKDAAKFKDAQDKMIVEMGKVIVAAKSGKADDLKAVFAGAAGSCKNCHDNFRSQ